MNVEPGSGYLSAALSRNALLVAIGLAVALVGCGGPPPPKRPAGPPEPGQCVGGLCVRPDHVLARKSEGRRCLIVAWDGESTLPPTAKIGFTDESPARPGVFLAIEVPGLLAGVPYRIASDPTKPKSTSVLAVRVDPGVKFADHRVAEKGEVTVIPSGDDLLVIAKTTFGEQEQTLQLTVPKAHNGCGPALVF